MSGLARGVYAQVRAHEKLNLAAASAVTALGSVLLPLGFGALGWLLLHSSLREGLSAALASSDVLATAALVGLWSLLGSRLASVDKRFDAVDKRFDDLSGKLDAGMRSMDSRLVRLEAGQTVMDLRLCRIETSLGRIEELLRCGAPGADGR